MFFSFMIFFGWKFVPPPQSHEGSPRNEIRKEQLALSLFPTATKKQQIANVILSWHEQTQTTKYGIPFPY